MAKEDPRAAAEATMIRLGWPPDWRERIKADLARQLEAGGTLYGVRSDGAYIARTKHGDEILEPPGSRKTR